MLQISLRYPIWVNYMTFFYVWIKLLKNSDNFIFRKKYIFLISSTNRLQFLKTVLNGILLHGMYKTNKNTKMTFIRHFYSSTSQTFAIISHYICPYKIVSGCTSFVHLKNGFQRLAGSCAYALNVLFCYSDS